MHKFNSSLPKCIKDYQGYCTIMRNPLPSNTLRWKVSALLYPYRESADILIMLFVFMFIILESDPIIHPTTPLKQQTQYMTLAQAHKTLSQDKASYPQYGDLKKSYPIKSLVKGSIYYTKRHAHRRIHS